MKYFATCTAFMNKKRNSMSKTGSSKGDGEQDLQLNSFGLRRVPKFVWRQVGLKKLNLRDNRLSVLPSEIENLVNLEVRS